MDSKFWLGRRITLRIRIMGIMAAMVLLMLVLIVVSYINAFNVIRNNAYASYTSMLELYVSDMDNAFRAAEASLVSLQSNASVPALQHPENRTEFFSDIYRLRTSLTSMVQGLTFVDEVFVCIPDKTVCANGDIADDAFIAVDSSDMAYNTRHEIEEMMTAYIRNRKEERLPSRWFLIKGSDGWYICKILKSYNVYLGTVSAADSILNNLQDRNADVISFSAVFGPDGSAMGDTLPEEANYLKVGEEADSFNYQMAGHNYLVIAQPSEAGGFSLGVLIQERNLHNGLGILLRMVFAMLAVGAVFFLLLALVLRKWILKPVNDLAAAMEKVRFGDLAARADEASSAEFAMISDTFNDMVRSINDLTIGIYEEKVGRQRAQLTAQNAEIAAQNAELQYLKLQINPHFYINCLNVINNLAIMHKEDLIQEMTGYLGNHLRYTLEGNTLDSLEREIGYVENYLNIQKLRFPQSIFSYIEIEPGLEKMQIPPLTVQTFVENTIKYQAKTGARTEIYVIAEREEETGGTGGTVPMVRIEIWDNGSGYPADVLEKLASGERITDELGEHYGIRNVIQRLHIIYKGTESLKFANHEETGGAHIIMELPFGTAAE